MSNAKDGHAGATPRYGVVGNPVAHSLSPQIHAAFAAQTGLAVDYRRVLAPLDGFDATIERFFGEGGRGLNVTLPFKLDAYRACGSHVSVMARQAGAVNWLALDEQGLIGDNTDGVGLVADLKRLLASMDRILARSRVLLIGAGGAARGATGPLLDSGIDALVVVNRDHAKAVSLVEAFGNPRGSMAFEARSYDAVRDQAFDVIVNATSASLADQSLPLARSVFANVPLVYDMMYAATPTRFLVDAREAGAATTADGLGMLVEQAAESFLLWRDVRPETGPVLEQMRALLATKSSA